jgi:hypothetical protein
MQISIKKQFMLLLSCALFTATITFLIFMGAIGNDFVDLDDLGYIVENRHLDSLNWQTVVWAFTSFHEANWHPLTMLSLALDRQIWGESPSGFHLVNIIIHSCTVFCSCFIFFPLLKMISVRNRYADNDYLIYAATFASALIFGIHPLRVESVVWVSERKDVLCLFFIVCAVWWHLRYVSRESLNPGISFIRSASYWMVILMSSLALMSKPAAVTIPFLLLLIDFYPLSRIVDRSSLLRMLYEKIPLLIISFAAALLTVSAQQYAITMAPQVNVISRLLIACKAVVYYLWKMLWPVNLAPYYPHPGNVTPDTLYGYLMYPTVLLISAVVFILLRRRNLQMLPILALYYLISLLPMLGIIQVGGQWIADRYTYLPALGISLFWGGGSVLLCGRFWLSGRKVLSCIISLFLCLQLSVYIVMTCDQIKVWRNNETLASREIELFPLKSGAAYYSRAKYRKEHGKCQEALLDIDSAVAIALRNNLTKKYADLSMSRAEVFVCLGLISEAVTAADWAIQTSGDEDRPVYIEYRKRLEERFAVLKSQ